MPAAQQRDRGDDAPGLAVRGTYGKPVTGPVRRNELCDDHQVGGLNGVEPSKAPNRQSRSLDQQISPGTQVDQADNERPECQYHDEGGNPAGPLPADQRTDAD